jgi:hypothetical protein
MTGRVESACYGEASDVRYWHLADMTSDVGEVRYRG